MDSMYLENLDEYINDEGRIVTCKWLSLTLKVQANVAKQMLFHYVSKQRSIDNGDELNVTYLVSGTEAGVDEQPDIQKLVLVREENLASVKEKMKDVISVHIYSVQKSKLKDLNVLHTANYDIIKKELVSISRYSGIECPAAKVRSSADLAKLQELNAYQAPAEPAPLQKKAKPPQDKVSPKKEPGSEEKGAKSNNAGKQTSKNQIASMFARQNVKTEDKKDEKKVEKQEVSKPASAGSKKGGISAFFNKAPATKKSPDSTKTSPIKSEPVDSPTSTSDSSKLPLTESEPASTPTTESLISSIKTEESQDSTALESQTDLMDVDTPPPKKTKAKSQSKLKPKKTTQKRGKSKRCDDESPIPKRKRIMQMSDSESSSDEDNEGEDESPFPSSPVPEPVRIESDDEEIPATPKPERKVELSKNGRPKKRKLVSKTFMDDDGYFVTKKEVELVSDSGEEEEVQSNEENIPAKSNTNSPKKPVDKSPQKKKTNSKSPQIKSPQKKHSKDVTKTKQSSIMSFFGKK